MTETITLSEPIKVDGVETYLINMRPALVEDILAIEKNSGSLQEQEVALFSYLCGLAVKDIQKMTWKEYRKLQSTFKKMSGEESPLE